MSSSLSSIFTLVNAEIYVITAAHQGLRGGQVATWVMLASLVPEQMRVVAVISPCNFTYTLMQASQQFVLHLLAQGQQDWLPLFGMHSGHQTDKFAQIDDLQFTQGGIPILPGTCGWIKCNISHQINTGDRIILIADGVESHLNSDRKPLRRIEALEALPEAITQALLQQRQADIERDRNLITPHITPH